MNIHHKIIVDVSILENDETLKLDDAGFESITKGNLRIQEKLRQLFIDGKVLAVHTNETSTIQISNDIKVVVSVKPVAKLKDIYRFEKPMEVSFMDTVNIKSADILERAFLELLKELHTYDM